MTRRKLLLVFPVIIAAALCFIFLQKTGSSIVSQRQTAFKMGTVVSASLFKKQWTGNESAVQEKLKETEDAIFSQIDNLDNATLSWRSESSEAFHFNHETDTTPFACSKEFHDAVLASLKLAEDSYGALDITLHPVIEEWGIENYEGTESYVPPDEKRITELKAITGAAHLSVGETSVQKDDADVQVDFGAIGKGYALDIALGLLKHSDVDGAVLSVGGSILIYGEKGAEWQIGIRDPEGAPSDFLGKLSIPGGSEKTTFVSTSGGYEKFVEYQGRTLVHIIDGRTLRPAESTLYSVTVVTSDNGLLSDGLSTACYILGMEGSKELLKKYDAEAIFLTKSKDVFITQGLSGLFSLSSMDYHFGGVL